MRFVWFSYYKTANRTTPCDAVQYGALLLMVWCAHAILRRFMCGFCSLCILCSLVNTPSFVCDQHIHK